MGTTRNEFSDQEKDKTEKDEIVEDQKEKDTRDFWVVESDEEVVKHLNLNFPR